MSEVTRVRKELEDSGQSQYKGVEIFKDGDGVRTLDKHFNKVDEAMGAIAEAVRGPAYPGKPTEDEA